MNSFARLHLQCCDTKSLFHTLLQPLLHESAQSHEAQSGIIVQTVQLSKNGLNNRADGRCLTISALKKQTSKPTNKPTCLTLVHIGISKRLIVINCIYKQSVTSVVNFCCPLWCAILSDTITMEAQWAVSMFAATPGPKPILSRSLSACTCLPKLKAVSALWSVETEVLGWLQLSSVMRRPANLGKGKSCAPFLGAVAPVLKYHWNCDCAVRWLKDLMETNKKNKSPITGVSIIIKAGGGTQRQGHQHNYDFSVGRGQQTW